MRLRRLCPRHLDEAGLNQLFTRATAFRGGLADQIAAHLLVEGPFNVNSTSVEAWKTLLSSLRGKPVAYLDKNKALAGVINPDEATPAGTPVASFTLPNSGPAGASADPKDPAQWLGWRELNDTEINELALAIVKQVKLRGPFLSLSEFVNRRLDSANTDLSVKGALQAALDDQSVSINAGFRNNARQFSSAERSSVGVVFPKAMEGPVAYGSAAYVDQADILRFLSFPKSADPVKVELRLVEGRTMQIEAPSNSFSRPVSVASPGVWMVGENVAGPDGKLVFKELGQTKALASPEQMLLIVRKDEEARSFFQQRVACQRTGPRPDFLLPRFTDHAHPHAHHPGLHATGLVSAAGLAPAIFTPSQIRVHLARISDHLSGFRQAVVNDA